MNKLTDADFLKLWEVLRKRKFYFILTYGCLMFAMPSYLLGLILSAVLWGETPITLTRLVVGVIIFSIAGYLFGSWLYAANELRYKKLMASGKEV